MVTAAPPPVSCLICPAMSSPAPGSALASIVCCAPCRVASDSAAGLVSTAITRAPAAAAIMVTDSPTPPQPKTASHSPGRTLPTAVTAR